MIAQIKDGVKEILAETNIQSDWEQQDDTLADFIKNKPHIPEGTGAVETSLCSPEPVTSAHTYDFKFPADFLLKSDYFYNFEIYTGNENNRSQLLPKTISVGPIVVTVGFGTQIDFGDTLYCVVYKTKIT